MAIQQIQEFRQKDGTDILKVILKPTKVFPEGSNYFYCPAEVIDLVQSRGWHLHKHGNGVAVVANNYGGIDYFHQELCYFYHGVVADYIDHINHCEIDNTDDNLNVVTSQQNQLNKFTRGYNLGLSGSKLTFQPRIYLNGQLYRPFGCINNEAEACILQHQAETGILRDMMGEDFYQFDFMKYRRGSEDVLDLERTGKISTEEATYKHILRYAENPWYMLRYGLEQYYKDNGISIPKYTLDEQGFMVHPITGQKLCPFTK